jgi:hypothetical protein
MGIAQKWQIDKARETATRGALRPYRVGDEAGLAGVIFQMCDKSVPVI